MFEQGGAMKLRSVSRGLFGRYLLSYLSVVLILCGLLSAALTSLSARELRQSEEEIYTARVTAAAEYIDLQLNAMENIRLKIKTSRTFMPFYLQQNHYHGRELMQVFSEYGDSFSRGQKYYLWYLNSGRVFGSSESYTPEVFLRVVLGTTKEEIASLADSAGSGGFSFRTRPDTGDILCCFPFYFSSLPSAREECLLLFSLSTALLSRDIATLTGTAGNGAFSLSYCGVPITQADLRDAVTSSSANGKVTLSLDKRAFSPSRSTEVTQRVLFIIVLAALFLGVLLSLLLAWRSYRPIRALSRKYAQGSAKGGDELQTIESLLIDSRENMASTQREMERQLAQLEKQQAWLKQQQVIMLINGSDSPALSRQFQELGYKTEHAMFSILFLHLEAGNPAEDLTKGIEAFSGAEYSLWAAELQSGTGYAVLVNFDEEDSIREILDMIGDMLGARGQKARVQVSRSCRTLADIAPASIAALHSRAVRLSDSGYEPESDDEAQGLEAILPMAKEGRTEQALTLLDSLIVRTNSDYPSFIMCIYMLNSMAQRIHSFALQNGTAHLPEITGNTDPQALADTMRRMIRAIGAEAEQTKSEEEEMRGGEVSSYIRENCLRSDLTLVTVAEAMNVCTRQITRQLRAEIGKTFKEYLVELRMDAAKRILREEDLSIAETAEKVGYYNISHFIKSFREHVGVTPGEWKRTQ